MYGVSQMTVLMVTDYSSSGLSDSNAQDEALGASILLSIAVLSQQSSEVFPLFCVRPSQDSFLLFSLYALASHLRES